MRKDGYFCIPNKRRVFDESTDIIVQTPDGEERLWGDRWDHLDGLTLVVFRDNRPLKTYIQGEWLGVHSFGRCVWADGSTDAEDEGEEAQDDEGALAESW